MLNKKDFFFFIKLLKTTKNDEKITKNVNKSKTIGKKF